MKVYMLKIDFSWITLQMSPCFDNSHGVHLAFCSQIEKNVIFNTNYFNFIIN